MIPDTQMNMQISFFFIFYMCLCVSWPKKNEKYFHFSVKKFTNDNKSWLANDQYTRNHNQCNDFKKKNLFYIIIHIGQNPNNLGTTYAKKKTQIPFPHTTFVHDDDNKNSIKNQQSVSVNFFFFFGYN